MKSIWVLSLLMTLMPQGQLPGISQDGTPMTVLSFKWHRDRQSVFYEPAATTPAPAMIPANKNFEKNRRANTSPGERDPNQDTLDGRSAALENAIQASRAPKPIEGFAFRARVHNGGGKPTEVIFWEYQFKDLSGEVISRKQFLCVATIKPEKDKELQAFSVSAPADVVSVGTLANKSGESSNGQVVINRVEYADGSIWQRKDWKFSEIRLSYTRAVATPWGSEMCRGL
jgi:hypothetical protein